MYPEIAGVDDVTAMAEEDMDLLRDVEQIKDCGDASMMPVYGGKMNRKSVAPAILGSIRR